MAEIKMTQVQALEIAVAEIENEEAREVISKMIETRKAAAERKRANKKPSKKAVENAEMAEQVREHFNGEQFTNAQVRELFGVSASKATAIIKAGNFEEVATTGKTRVFC